jgi:small-conductance mechanosensitive channel
MLWIGAANALPGELQSVGALFKTWGELIWRGGGALALITLALVIVLLGVVVRLLTRWAERYHAPSAKFDNQLSKARAAIAEFIRVAAVTPLVVIAVLLVVDAFVGSEIPPAIEAASNAIGVAVVIASFARGVATGLLALGHPERRMVDLDERAATVLYKHFVWAAYALALTVFAVLLHKIVTGQQIVADAMHALFALGVLGLLVRLLMSTNPDQDNGGGPDEPSRPRLGAPWLRAVAWLVAIAIVAALVLGYFSLAFFFAERLIATFAIFAAFAMLMVAVDALFTIESPRSRMIAANLGFSQRRVGFVGTLLSGAIRALLMLVALVLIMGPWEVSAADFLQAMKNLAFGFTVGGIQFSLGTIPIAIILLAAILAATRIGQRWLAQKLLPQTDLDLGLQNSIATVFGYLGVITAITVAFGYLGIDLQKIALIAGALSVGIGFGLQSVVSNFVSGLILLGERPIRVGDTIAVKGEEGWVRHIRVRSTEIETFDRATVIIPNSDLITGVVKNWTHATPFGRIIIKVGVGYASDPKTVQEILMSIAEAHKDVLKNPPPNVFFVGFGNSALDFELRCVVRHVDVAMGVKSEINFAILDRFRAAGIEIPYPQHEVRLRDGAGPSKAQPGSPQN